MSEPHPLPRWTETPYAHAIVDSMEEVLEFIETGPLGSQAEFLEKVEMMKARVEGLIDLAEGRVKAI